MGTNRLLNFIKIPARGLRKQQDGAPAAQSECSELCGHKDEKLGHKGADGAMAIQVHLDSQEQVPGLRDGLGEGHHPAVVVHLPGAEKALLIAAGDGQLHAVPGDGTGGAHAENHRGHLDVGGEREVVVGYSQRQRAALLILMARQALTAAARVDRETRRGSGQIQQAEKQQSAGEAGARGAGLPPPLWPGQSTGRAPLTHLWEVPWTSGPPARALASSNTLRGRWVAGVKGPTPGRTHQAHPALWVSSRLLAWDHPGSDVSTTSCCHLPSPWPSSITHSLV